jgi:hypothetical protein
MATSRVSAVVLAAVAALAVAAPATAKNLTRVTICGQRDDCAVIDDPERLRLVPLGGSTSVAPPPLQPFYLTILRIEHGGDAEEGLSVYYVRNANLLAANRVAPGELVWLPIDDPRSRRLMRDVVAGIEPHPAPSTWPRELKSTFRVIPDDELGDVQVSSAARPVRERRDEDRSAYWVAAAIALGLAAGALLLRRLSSHQARDQRRQALALEHAADALRDRQLDTAAMRELP